MARSQERTVGSCMYVRACVSRNETHLFMQRGVYENMICNVFKRLRNCRLLYAITYADIHLHNVMCVCVCV